MWSLDPMRKVWVKNTPKRCCCSLKISGNKEVVRVVKWSILLAPSVTDRGTHQCLSNCGLHDQIDGQHESCQRSSAIPLYSQLWYRCQWILLITRTVTTTSSHHSTPSEDPEIRYTTFEARSHKHGLFPSTPEVVKHVGRDKLYE